MSEICERFWADDEIYHAIDIYDIYIHIEDLREFRFCISVMICIIKLPSKRVGVAKAVTRSKMLEMSSCESNV